MNYVGVVYHKNRTRSVKDLSTASLVCCLLVIPAGDGSYEVLLVDQHLSVGLATRRISVRLLLLCFAISLSVVATPPSSALAQSAPEFRMGFETLAQLIPDKVGQPLENERFNPDTGQATQTTTNGLLVWTKATNTTAFTDGSSTWILGPLGLQVRSNDVRFSWEGPDSFATLSANAVTINRTLDEAGHWIVEGTITNSLGEPMNVEINLIALAAEDGAPVGDAPTLYISEIAPGASQPFTVRVPTTQPAESWRILVASQPSYLQQNLFLDVGTTSGLDVDPSLIGAAQTLRTVEGGEWLLRVAAENGVSIRSAGTPSNVLGAYLPDEDLVVISSGLNLYSSQVRAAVLAHELQHAASAAAGELPQTPEQCLQFEAQAFGREADVWNNLWGGFLPPDTNPVVAELNDITTTMASDPAAFTQTLIQRYGVDCGLVP
jgi:predicted Rdx family selenoprotein